MKCAEEQEWGIQSHQFCFQLSDINWHLTNLQSGSAPCSKQPVSTLGQGVSEKHISSWHRLEPLICLLLTGVIKVSRLPQSCGPLRPPGSKPVSAWEGPRKLRLHYQVPLGRQGAMCWDHFQDICLHEISPFVVSVGQESPPSLPGSLVTGLWGGCLNWWRSWKLLLPSTVKTKAH